MLNYESGYSQTCGKALEPSDLFFPEQIFFPFSEILLNIPDNVVCGLKPWSTGSHASG